MASYPINSLEPLPNQPNPKRKRIVFYVIVTIVALALIALAVAVSTRYFSQKETTQEEATTNGSQKKEEEEKLPDNTEKMTLQVFFNNNELDCKAVGSVSRTVPKTSAVGTAALKELFKGPSEDEAKNSFTSPFSSKTADVLLSLEVADGVAYTNLKDIRPIIPNVSSSCGSAQFLSEIETTLKQFSTVKSIILAINGSVKDLYEFLQIGCIEGNSYCDNTAFKKNLVRITTPAANQKITSPLTVEGEARGTWFFEASFPIKLYDSNGKLLGQSPAQAQGDWMTNEFVKFKATVTFSSPTTTIGVLVLEKDNPSGLPENADEVRLPVRLK